MGALSEQLAQLRTLAEVAASVCTVGILLDELDPEDRQALESALKSPASIRSIHKALRASGHVVDRNLLSIHRKGRCACQENNQ